MEQNPKNETPKEYPSYLFGGKPGRPKGSPNKSNLIQLEAARLARESPGIDAQMFLLKVMRDENEDMDRRIDAAKAVLPTTHARLAAIKVDNKQEVSVDWSPEQLYARLMEIMIRSGAIKTELLNQKAVQMLPSPEGIVPAGIELEGSEE